MATSQSHGSTLLGTSAIAVAAVLWAVAAVVARNLFDDGVRPVHLVEARAVITAAGLALVVPAWRRPAPGHGKPAIVAVLGLCLAAVNAAYYVAIDRLPVAVAIVLQYTAPVLVVAWVALAARRPPAPQVVAALVAAVAGVALVSEVFAGGLGGADRTGLAAGIASAVTFAIYTLLSETAGRAYGASGTMLRAFSVASVAWIAWQAPRGWPAALFEGATLPRVLFVGLGGTLAPFLLFVWGIRHVRSERASIAATLEPVAAAGLAWLWLGQSLSSTQIAGGVLVIGAVLAAQIRSPVAIAPEPGGVRVRG